jgi:cytochrome c-type biogenesis protein CcsB
MIFSRVNGMRKKGHAMLKKLLSMQAAVVMMVLFGVIIGAATFIENDYGTQTARALIYKAKWFEWFLFYFIVILTYQIFKYKTYKTKFPVFLFHFSFILVAVGALITRYVGYEGIMHIREGQTTNKMVSDVKKLELFAKTKEANASLVKTVFFSSMTPNHLDETLRVGDKTVRITLEKYLPTFEKKALKADKNGRTILEMKISDGGRGKIYYFAPGDIRDFGEFYLAYDYRGELPKDKPVFDIRESNGKLTERFDFSMETLDMSTRRSARVEPGEHPLHEHMLYRFGRNAVVLKAIHPDAKVEVVSSSLKNKPGMPEYVKMRVRVGDANEDVVFTPVKGQLGELKHFTLNGVDIQMRLGSQVITLPFEIKLTDFELKRYPGSMTPASYSSRVVLIDKERNLTMPYHIYMNHVLDHRNYRFFQSSYDPDEKGTVLSVNHDPGTLPTYIAYLLMGIGMIWSLFIPNGRFRQLMRRSRKLQESIGAFLLIFALWYPQHIQAALPELNATAVTKMKSIDPEHALNFGTIAAQDTRGRMKPMDTVAHEVIAKITGRTQLYGIEPDQMFLGMMMMPQLYQNIPMIKIGHPRIAKDLGLPEDAKYAAFNDFFDKEKGLYKLSEVINKAARKKPLEQSQYDKELIKIDERLNVAYMTYQGTFFRIYPIPGDPNNKWLPPIEAMNKLAPKYAQEVRMTISAYFSFVDEGIKTGKWEHANLGVKAIKAYQKKYGKAVLPSERHIKMEIWYNKLNLFSKLFPYYLTLGLLLLVFAFIHVLKPSFPMKRIMRIGWWALIAGFVVHVTGMGIRWYIAGHAPWSNAYESIVFIAAATILAGIVLARRSPFALAGAALLGGITMLVAHMSFINPEITNLVPVLKSYWLMIHVATIISGDGFLGLGSILSLMVLVLFIVRGKNGHPNIDRSIRELTALSEMSLIIGLMLLTLGNFLGGVWANESWGRYWGWDSKETWAAVTILIYAAVIHMRYVKSLNDIFLYNVAATWAYSTVLMTYFGVNYYLSGLHSYAAGDPVPIPVWVYYGVAGLLVLTLAAARHRKLSSAGAEI